MRHLYPDGLKTILLILVRPNSAFATIRDNAEKYIWWSVGGFILSSVIPALFLFSLIPPHPYWDEPHLFVIGSPLGFLVFIVFVCLIGWAKHGNRYWKKTFSVLFCVWIAVSLPAYVVAPILYASGLIIYEDEIELWFVTFYFYLYLISSAIWLIILTIKAIKIINKWYDTWKAIIVAIPGYISMGLFYALLGIGPISITVS